jgi:hypothetical protein
MVEISTMAKQLNIKNPRAYELATRIAKARNMTTTAVVVEALERMDPDVLPPLNADKQARIDRWLAALERDWAAGLAGSIIDHNDLYDENGLPK